MALVMTPDEAGRYGREVWPELSPADIADLVVMVDGEPATRGHWPDLADMGLLSSPYGVPTDKARALISWARRTGLI